MTVRTPGDLEGLRHVGRLVAGCLARLEEAVRPGMTTADLDAIARDYLSARGAASGPQRDYGFPGFTCISVNDEIVHGVPGPRLLRPGDLVKLDVTAVCDGYLADAARSVAIPPVPPVAARLVACVREAFDAALAVIRAGAPVVAIGRAVEATVARHGLHVVRELSGHGVGRRVHEPPEVPNYDEPRCRATMHDGLVLAVEPIVAGTPAPVVEAADRWTVRTADGALAAHHEHTLVVRPDGPLVLTAAA